MSSQARKCTLLQAFPVYLQGYMTYRQQSRADVTSWKLSGQRSVNALLIATFPSWLKAVISRWDDVIPDGTSRIRPTLLLSKLLSVYKLCSMYLLQNLCVPRRHPETGSLTMVRGGDTWNRARLRCSGLSLRCEHFQPTVFSMKCAHHVCVYSVSFSKPKLEVVALISFWSTSQTSWSLLWLHWL